MKKHTWKAKLEKATDESTLSLATTSKESKASMHKHTTTLLQNYYLHFPQPNRTTGESQIEKQNKLSQKQTTKVSNKPKRKIDNYTKKVEKQMRSLQKLTD